MSLKLGQHSFPGGEGELPYKNDRGTWHTFQGGKIWELVQQQQENVLHVKKTFDFIPVSYAFITIIIILLLNNIVYFITQ